jgi:GTPase
MRTGFCAIVGRPNVGKSTYLNRTLGQKLAAVTPKPQTTRNRIVGVKNRPDAQIVYVDTPGIHRARSGLNRYMVEQARAAMAECDAILLLVEAPKVPAAELAGPGEGTQAILDELAKIDKPRLLGINKVDRLRDKAVLLPQLSQYQALLPWHEMVPLSAATGDGVEVLERAIASCLPEGEPLYPEEMVTDRAERFLAAELVREQAFLLLAEELPYSVAVTVERWEERAAKKDVVIEAVIHVERDSQRKIVIGQGGQMVKEIGQRARREIGALLGCPVHLLLHVKTDPEWTRTQASLRRLGYE